MTVQQAYKIFDVRSDITKMELKKRYRRLMHMVHPDAVLNRDKSNKENVYCSFQSDWAGIIEE